ncbi:MAG: hypothetical protein JXA13_03600 [Anaerolineales bacterium]|nr:hypothetical protein [Anaerolineales bacterium]
MKIKILGTESLGVRGLSCEVRIENRKVVIDPGLALVYRRYGLLPHPVQAAVGERVRMKITAALENATDIVFSHFHRDHIPLLDANPFQLSAPQVAHLFRIVRLWSKGSEGLSNHMALRRKALIEILGRDLPNAENQKDGPLKFSLPVPHGNPNVTSGKVIMTRMEDGDGVFVHSSDIQLLDSEALEIILAWQPDIVLASGPALYHTSLSPRQQRQAWNNAVRLANGVYILILDHHLLRSTAGLRWVEHLASKTGRNVLCAADFMGHPRCLLEAQRVRLYNDMPVPDGWHEADARDETDTSTFQVYTGTQDNKYVSMAALKRMRSKGDQAACRCDLYPQGDNRDMEGVND